MIMGAIPIISIVASSLTAVFLIALALNLYAAPAGNATGRTAVVLAKVSGVSFVQVLKDTAVLPFWLPGWLLGRLWWLLRVAVAALVTGFVEGASRA